MDKTKFQYEGIKWLAELELINHPQLINTVKFNILTVSKRIKEVELLIYREQKSMLVLLELSWLGSKFFKKQIFTEVQELLTQLLPNFRFRVTDDPKIMNMAIALVQKAVSGGNDEKNTDSSTNVVSPVDIQESTQSSTESINEVSVENTSPNKKE